MRKMVAVFTPEMAKMLVGEGYVCEYMNAHRKNPKQIVYHFRNAPGIFDDLNRFKEGNKMKTKHQNNTLKKKKKKKGNKKCKMAKSA